MDEILQKLKSEIDITSWEMIHPHHVRDAVFIVNKPMELWDVGKLIAENKAHLVKALLDSNELRRPTENEIAGFKNDEKLKFKFLIIQPFVLVQIQENI
jgi:hypothetical protein